MSGIMDGWMDGSLILYIFLFFCEGFKKTIWDESCRENRRDAWRIGASGQAFDAKSVDPQLPK
jgi:hypothetical protein